MSNDEHRSLDPFTDLRQTMDQLFEQGFSRPWRYLQSDNYQMTLPVEVWPTDETVEVKAALPGVRPDLPPAARGFMRRALVAVR